MGFMEYLQNDREIIKLFITNDERIKAGDEKSVRCKWIGKGKKVFKWI